MQAGNQCCGHGGSCGPGNNCYWFPRYQRGACCTDSACTAYVENGQTIYQQQATPAPTAPQRPPPAVTVTQEAPPVVTVTEEAPPGVTVTEFRQETYYFVVTW